MPEGVPVTVGTEPVGCCAEAGCACGLTNINESISGMKMEPGRINRHFFKVGVVKLHRLTMNESSSPKIPKPASEIMIEARVAGTDSYPLTDDSVAYERGVMGGAGVKVGRRVLVGRTVN